MMIKFVDVFFLRRFLLIFIVFRYFFIYLWKKIRRVFKLYLKSFISKCRRRYIVSLNQILKLYVLIISNAFIFSIICVIYNRIFIKIYFSTFTSVNNSRR